MKDFTAKEQIFLLDIMIGNLWLFLDRTSLLSSLILEKFSFMLDDFKLEVINFISKIFKDSEL